MHVLTKLLERTAIQNLPISSALPIEQFKSSRILILNSRTKKYGKSNRNPMHTYTTVVRSNPCLQLTLTCENSPNERCDFSKLVRTKSGWKCTSGQNLVFVDANWCVSLHITLVEAHQHNSQRIGENSFFHLSVWLFIDLLLKAF